MTPGQRWKRKRNLAIASASLSGASQRFLGDVFDVAHTTVGRVLEDFETEFAPSGGLNQATLERELEVMQGNQARRRMR